jgi:hypothetical protein
MAVGKTTVGLRDGQRAGGTPFDAATGGIEGQAGATEGGGALEAGAGQIRRVWDCSGYSRAIR